MRSNKRINPTRRSARLPWNRSARGLCATTLGVLIGTVFELRRLMVIEITRVPTRFWSARCYSCGSRLQMQRRTGSPRLQ